jgi:hypothetical protein
MYSTSSGLIFGFHGCDQSIVEDVINGRKLLEPSNNDYDWIGNGIYFWQNSTARALHFARSLVDNPRKGKEPIKNPAVIGAIIDLGYCLDLLDFSNLSLLPLGFEAVKVSMEQEGFKMPENKPIGDEKDLLVRKLDCMVIETIHKINGAKRQFDSVRGVFWEGAEPYPNAGFRDKNHIQICIRNPNCIKGYFLPREINEFHSRV